jgi:aryl sulfotransferase
VIERPARYISPDEDSARWDGFPFRAGDIVISTRSKTGTTWVQMICALLIFQQPQLDAPVGWYSPWLDRLTRPKEEVFARLAAQQHRRFIKTHTPLDGIPVDLRATYIVVGRHPLDSAVSLYYQGQNINRARQRQLTEEATGQPMPADPDRPRKPVREWLLDWIDNEASPQQEMDSIRGVFWHGRDAWARRAAPNVVLLHYAELSADLDGQMRQLAARLGISVPDPIWPDLVEAATFASMRAQAEKITGAGSILKSPAAFFRRGTSGAGSELLTEGELRHYHGRAAELAPPDMLDWLHRPGDAGLRCR